MAICLESEHCSFIGDILVLGLKVIYQLHPLKNSCKIKHRMPISQTKSFNSWGQGLPDNCCKLFLEQWWWPEVVQLWKGQNVYQVLRTSKECSRSIGCSGKMPVHRHVNMTGLEEFLAKYWQNYGWCFTSFPKGLLKSSDVPQQCFYHSGCCEASAAEHIRFSPREFTSAPFYTLRMKGCSWVERLH